LQVAEKGPIRGRQLAVCGDKFAIGDGNVVKMVGKDGKILWASRNYTLDLSGAIFDGVKGISERNVELWK